MGMYSERLTLGVKKIEKCMGLTQEDGALFLEFYGILWFYDFIDRLHAFMITETDLFCQINLFRLQLEREWSNGRND